MAEKTSKTTQSLRRLKITGVALLVVFGPLLLLYSWLALRPTGYGDLRERMPESVEAMERRLSEAGARSNSSPVKKVAESERLGKSEAKAEDLLAVLGSDEWEGPAGRGGSWSEAEIKQLEIIADNLSGSMPGGIKWYGGDLNPWQRPDGNLKFTAGDEEVVRKSAQRNWMWREAGGPAEHGPKLFQREDAGYRWMTKGADRVERLLLNRASADGLRYLYADQVFNHYPKAERMGLLAMLRAAAAGDALKAEELFLGQLAMYQELRLRTFPGGQARFYGAFDHPFVTTIMWAARIDGMPDAAFGRADDLLAGFRITEAEAGQFRMLYANAVTQTYGSMLERDHVSALNETFRYFFDGAPQRYWRRAMSPALRNNLQRLAVAWSDDDADAWKRAETEHQRLLSVLNIKQPGALGLFYQRVVQFENLQDASVQPQIEAWRNELSRRMSGQSMNDEIDMARLVLAAERYRRAKGEYPRTLEAMTPEFLAEEEITTLETQYAILWVEPFQRLFMEIPGNGIADRNEKIEMALYYYREANSGEEPESPEALRAYLADDADYELAKRAFRKFDGRPVFCVIRRQGNETLVDRLFIMFPAIPEWVKEWAAGEKQGGTTSHE